MSGTAVVAVYDRLTKVLPRFTDTNEGTRMAAFNTFLAIVDTAKIDLRDLCIVQIDRSASDAEAQIDARVARMKEAMKGMGIPTVDDNLKLQAKIDELSVRNEAMKAEIRDLKKENKSLKEKVERAKKPRPDKVAKPAPPKKLFEWDLVTRLRRAVVVLADKMTDYPMQAIEFQDWAAVAYPKLTFQEVLIEYGFEQMPDPIPPWVRVMIRAERPKIVRRIEPNE